MSDQSIVVIDNEPAPAKTVRKNSTPAARKSAAKVAPNTATMPAPTNGDLPVMVVYVGNVPAIWRRHAFTTAAVPTTAEVHQVESASYLPGRLAWRGTEAEYAQRCADIREADDKRGEALVTAVADALLTGTRRVVFVMVEHSLSTTGGHYPSVANVADWRGCIAWAREHKSHGHALVVVPNL